MELGRLLAERLGVRPAQVQATIELLDAGNTVPFIARYRKEVTGGLDDEQLRRLEEGLTSLRALEERREAILQEVGRQGRLTPELEAEFRSASTLTALEDLYLPYRPRRRTRAQMAREKGLEPLAERIMAQKTGGPSPETEAAHFLTPEVPGVEEALAGARDIVAERISEDPRVRGPLREKATRWGILATKKAPRGEDPKAVFQTYYEFTISVERIRPHQVLALNRGEAEGVLKTGLEVPERDWRESIQNVHPADRRSPWAGQFVQAAEEAASRLLLPAVERDVRRQLTEKAEEHAIGVFAENLRSLLGGPPLPGHVVLGLDPGFRTGCKLAVVDATGRVLQAGTIHPHPPQNQRREALAILRRLVGEHRVSLVAIGNGTASRETEALVAELVREVGDLHYVMVDEAGASVYSASALAREELPGMDVTLRGAVSIARRLQDPLAELVKVEPRSIGVGMYQHDLNQNRLVQALERVVEDVVNRVGVDLNTASPALLTHVAGLGPKLARSVVAWRDQNGPFARRKDLLKVPGLGPKSFQQAAGFLRIREGREPLDATAIHPESYEVARAVLQRAGISTMSEPSRRAAALEALLRSTPLPRLAHELGTGEPTLSDILEQLVRPGRDPRQDLPTPLLRRDVLALEDLQPGMRLHGTVRNVVDFGAFVDIGVKQDGLLHSTRIPRGVAVRPGDVVEITVLRVEAERGRISLGWAGGA